MVRYENWLDAPIHETKRHPSEQPGGRVYLAGFEWSVHVFAACVETLRGEEEMESTDLRPLIKQGATAVVNPDNHGL